MPHTFIRQKQASMRRSWVTVHIALMVIVTVAAAMSIASMLFSSGAENLASTLTLPVWNEPSPADAPNGPVSCQMEENSDYHARSVVLWGSHNIKSQAQPHIFSSTKFILESPASAKECCDSCIDTEGCNVWVFCPSSSACGENTSVGECWLKAEPDLDLDEPNGRRGPGVALKPEERQSILAKRAQEAAVLAERRNDLRANTSMPLVFLDVSIKGQSLGRMEFVRCLSETPNQAHDDVSMPSMTTAGFFRSYLRKKHHLQLRTFASSAPGSYFYRIIHKFIDQSGVMTESVYGGRFDDDPGGLGLKHDRFGLLSMANSGPNTNTAHFSIVVAPAPHLDGSYTIFGELVSGADVAVAINNVSAEGMGGYMGTATQSATCTQLQAWASPISFALHVSTN